MENFLEEQKEKEKKIMIKNSLEDNNFLNYIILNEDRIGWP
jgi:hypothetical protein